MHGRENQMSVKIVVSAGSLVMGEKRVIQAHADGFADLAVERGRDAVFLESRAV